ncbi:hypothetical protein [Ramlibacter sp.]|uniref:hypothetical protein n=1 Tax=Ramlibacter sp. TaxID=1917967 RepID=UPI003D0D184F
MIDSQISLIPIQLVDEQPVDRSLSKDLLWTGCDEQGKRYALKTVERAHPLLPLTEWLCYHLCSRIGVLIPEYTVVVRLDGSLAFGSLWEIDARQFSPASVSEAQFFTWLESAKSDVNAMFALDAFLPNEDRHFGNMLFVDTGARVRALAFDWSRARIFNPWPWPADCKSERSWNWLAHVRLHDPKLIRSKLDRLQLIPGTDIRQILMAAPAEWRMGFDLDQSTVWWEGHRSQRVDDTVRLLRP